MDVKEVQGGNETEDAESLTPPHLWLAYAAPMAVFIGLTALEGQVHQAYVWFYIGKIITLAAVLWICRKVWSDIRWEPRVLPIAILVGLAVFAEWALVDNFLTQHHISWMHFGSRTEFNPFEKMRE